MEDEYDIALKNYYGSLFYYKIFFLPSVILFPCLLFIEVYRNYYYIFLSIFTSLLIITWNFPSISKFIYSKPIYIEDLDKKISGNNNKIIYDIQNSQTFKSRFILFQQFIISIVIALSADYIKSRFYENSNENMSNFAIIGILGGLLSITIKVIKLLGKICLFIVYYKQKKYQESLDNQNNNIHQIIILENFDNNN